VRNHHETIKKNVSTKEEEGLQEDELQEDVTVPNHQGGDVTVAGEAATQRKRDYLVRSAQHLGRHVIHVAKIITLRRCVVDDREQVLQARMTKTAAIPQTRITTPRQALIQMGMKRNPRRVVLMPQRLGVFSIVITIVKEESNFWSAPHGVQLGVRSI
jgi:hypothetical protein